MQKIDSKTSLYGILGDPVAHSLSPLIHNAAFSQTKINACYLAFKTKQENLKEAILGAKALNVKGLSITIPHKTNVIDFLDEIDPLAKKINAVNTIVNKEGYLKGYNTDCFGALKALSEKCEIENKKIAIIGAGGASKAIFFALLQKKCDITVINRNLGKAEKLVTNTAAKAENLFQISNNDFDVVINTSSVGMFPKVDDSPVQKDFIKKSMIVMDIVYNPIETKFLRYAKDAGANIIDGTKMFLYQAALQFELWTKKKAPLDLIKKLIINSL